MWGSIFGYVVRGDTERPVAGALVSIVSARAPAPDFAPELGQLTNSAGWFAWEGLPEGQWLVIAVEPKSGRGEANVSVFDNSITEVTVRLNRFHRWLASAQVDEMEEMRSPGSDSDLDDTSETTGLDDVSPAPAFREPVRKGSVRGRVVYASSGSPVAEATITFEGEAGPAPDIAPVTNAEGKFSMDGLPWGTWRFYAIDPQGRRGTAEVHIGGYNTAKVTIRIF
jgi:hypothetical protein